MKILDKIRKKFFIKITNPLALKFMNNGNKFMGYLPKIRNSKITIKGQNNILFCEKDVVISDSTISFNGNNSLIYLSSGAHRCDVLIFNNSVLHIGKYNYFNPFGKNIQIYISEERNVLIGNYNLFSYEIFIRTADPHLIYDSVTHNRINMSKSVYIGDHVWFGQDAIILKGAQIHSGSIIGTKSLITGKAIPSNETWGGCPAKRIRNNVFWETPCVHAYTKEDTIKSMHCETDEHLYYPDENSISFEEIENNLQKFTFAKDKLLYLQNLPQGKNRFSR